VFRTVKLPQPATPAHARGDVFIFVDADTLASESAVEAALTLREGAAGGASVHFDGRLPLYAKLLLPLSIGFPEPPDWRAVVFFSARAKTLKP
jgi:hypothetical protein